MRKIHITLEAIIASSVYMPKPSQPASIVSFADATICSVDSAISPPPLPFLRSTARYIRHLSPTTLFT